MTLQTTTTSEALDAPHLNSTSGMVSTRDFPPLPVCEACKRLFVDCNDPHNDKTIQHQMLTTDGVGGYHFTRIREHVEVAAIRGCVFCRAIISQDAKYLKKDAEPEDVEEDEEYGDGSDDGSEDADKGEDRTPDSRENEEDSSDGDYGSSTDDVDVRSNKSWDRPWDSEYAFMMVYNPGGEGYKPRPDWFPPLDETIELMLKYD